MRIKKDSSDKSTISKIASYIFTKRKTIAFIGYIFLLIAVLFFGVILGMLLTGFFGTLDNPSESTLDIIRYFGFEGLSDGKFLIQNVAGEGFSIPFNFIRGQASRPERLSIDIIFENYQKIAFKREKALEAGTLVVEDGDEVPIEITYNNQKYKADARLKGDNPDHYKTNKWSLRIDLKGDNTILGVKTFSLQHPKTRNYLYDYIFYELMRQEGIIAIRTDFVEVIINGKNMGIYEFEEHFDKRLIENNLRREGPIVKFNENYIHKEKNLGINSEQLKLFPTTISNLQKEINEEGYLIADIDSFKTTKTISNPVLYEQYTVAKNLLENFRSGKLSTSEVFEVDILAKYFALNELTGGQHSSAFSNIRFYYNPVTSKLEPIPFDGSEGGTTTEFIFNNEHFVQPYMKRYFEDIDFFEKYIKELDRISNKEFLNEFFKEKESDIKQKENIIFKDFPFYHYTNDVYYQNQETIKKLLNPHTSVKAYLLRIENNTLHVEVANAQTLPLQVKSLSINETEFSVLESKILKPKLAGEQLDFQTYEFKVPENYELPSISEINIKINTNVLGLENTTSATVFPWPHQDETFLENDLIRQEPNYKELDYLTVNEDDKTIFFSNEYVLIDEDVIIPQRYKVLIEEGTILDLVENTVILSYSPILSSGTEEAPVIFYSSDGTGQGLVVLEAEDKSVLENTQFIQLSSPERHGWNLTGSVTFYKSPLEANKLLIKDVHAEDGLNVISSNLIMTNSVIENTLSDCFDGDFVTGKIQSSSFINCGNDGIDISGSDFAVDSVLIINAGDKGISSGEDSKLKATNILINGSFIGVASKDKSDITISDIEISNTEYGFASYTKKGEFGPGNILIEDEPLFENLKQDHIVETNSNITVQGKEILKFEENVYFNLYGEEE